MKPGNVLLAAYGQPALTDFGLSVLAERQELSVGIDALTPYHAAPEVLERTAVGAPSDVYSLASTTYAMLAGRAPHQSVEGPDSMAALLLRILQVDVPPVGRPDVPPSLDAALRSGLARDPAVRTPTALAFAQALQQAQRELGLEVTEPVVFDVAKGGEAAPAPPLGRRPPRAPSPAARGAPPGPPAFRRGSGGATAWSPTCGPPSALRRSGATPPSTAPACPAPRGTPTATSRRPRRPDPQPSRSPPPHPPSPRRPARPAPRPRTAPRPPAAAPGRPPGQVAVDFDPATGVPIGWAGGGAVDGEATVHREQVRGGRPVPLASPAPRRSTWKVVLVVVGALVAVGAAVAGGMALLDRSPADPEPPADGTTTTTVPVDVPTDVLAVESQAGVQVDWAGEETADYTVLVLSEADRPTALPAPGSTSLLIPATTLRPDTGYCFSVARVDAVNAAPEGGASKAFSPPVCVRGASRDTVRVD